MSGQQSSINSQAEYNSKRDEVLNRFRKEFDINLHLRTDATFVAVVEMLIRDADPYAMIERLIEDRKILLEKVIEFHTLNSVPVIKG